MRNAVSVNSGALEEHIVSVIVHLNKDYLHSALATIDKMERVEIVVQQECKSVLLLNERSAKAVMVKIEELQDIPGVLNVAMIAHHTERPDSLDQALEEQQDY